MPYPLNNFALDEDQRRSIEAARLGSQGPTAPAMPAYRIGPTPGLTASGRRLGELQFGAGPLQQPAESFGTPTDFARELLGGMAAAPGTALKSLVHGGQYLGNVAGQVGNFLGLPQNLNPEGNKRPENYGAYRLGQGIEDMAARTFGGAEPTFMGRVGGATGFVGRMAGAGALAGPPGVMAAAAGESMAPSYETATELGADPQTATLRAAQSGVLNAGLMGLGGPTAMIDRVLGSTAEQVARAGVYESMRRLGAEAIKGGFNMSALAAATTVGESAIQEQPMSLRNTLESAAEAFPVGMVVGGGAKLVGEARLPGPGIRESIKTEGEAAAKRIAESNVSPRTGIDPKLAADYGKVAVDMAADALKPTAPPATSDALETARAGEAEFKPSRAPRIGETIPPPPKGVLPFKEAIPKGQVTEGVPGSDPTKLHKGAQIPFEQTGTLKPGEAREMIPEDLGTTKGPPPKEGVLDTNKLPEGAFEDFGITKGRHVNDRVMKIAEQEIRAGHPEAGQAIYTIGKRLKMIGDKEKAIAGSVRLQADALEKKALKDKSLIAELSELIPATSITGKPIKGAYFSKLQDAIDYRQEQTVGGIVGTADYHGLSPKGREYAVEHARINKKAIEKARELGDQWIQNPDTGEWVHITKTLPENRFPRLRTGEEVAIWTDPYNAEHKDLIRILAEGDNIDIQAAEARFQKAFTGVGKGDATVGALSVMRSFRVFPAAKDSVAKPGKKIQLLVTDPVDALKESVDSIAKQGAFNAQFPQGSYEELANAAMSSAKNPARVRDELDRARRHGQSNRSETDERMANLGRSLTGEGTGILGKALKLGGRLVNAGSTVIKGLNLTAAAAPQTIEPLGSLPAYVGAKHTAKAYLETVTSPRETVRRGTETGAIHHAPIDMRIRSIEDAARVVNAATTKTALFTDTNRLNDTTVYAAGESFVREIKADAAAGKKPDAAIIDSLQRLKFDKGQIRNIVNGKASQLVYDSVARRLVSFTQGEQQHALEKGKYANSATLNWFKPFLRYTFLATDQVITAASNMKHAWSKASQIPDGPQRWERVRVAAQAGAKLAGLKVATGAAATAIIGVILGKSIHRDDEGWMEWLAKNAAAAGLGSPITSIGYTAKQATEAGTNPIPNMLIGGQPVIAFLSNLQKTLTNAREYKDLEPLEAWWQFAKQTAPGLRIAGGILTTMGFGENPELAKYIRKSYEIKKELGYLEGGVETGFDQFRHDMKALSRYVKEGNLEAATGQYYKILKDYQDGSPGSSPRERVEASVRGRLALSGKSGSGLSPADRELFKQRLGEKGYALLEAHDKAMMAIPYENLGAAGEFYYKLHTLRADFKASKNIKKPRELAIAEAFSGKINDVQKVIDKKGDDPERLKRLSATKEKLFNLAVKRLSLPDTGNAKINLDAEVDRIMQEMN